MNTLEELHSRERSERKSQKRGVGFYGAKRFCLPPLTGLCPARLSPCFAAFLFSTCSNEEGSAFTTCSYEEGPRKALFGGIARVCGCALTCDSRAQFPILYRHPGTCDKAGAGKKPPACKPGKKTKTFFLSNSPSKDLFCSSISFEFLPGPCARRGPRRS